MRFGTPTKFVAVLLGLGSELDVIEARQERAQLHAREVRAQAEVDPEAEGDVVHRSTVHR
jgi:hypothetical protein